MFFIIWHLITYLGEKSRSLGFARSLEFLISARSLWLESSEQSLPISLVEVLRLRAIRRPYARVLRGASLRMTALRGG
jgi:hypothetical protein